MQRKPILVTLALLIVFAIVSAGSSGGQRALASTALSATTATQPASPEADLGPSFTYQGKLDDASVPANGQYDFQFRLYDALVGGTQLGFTNNIGNVTVTNGLFTVTLSYLESFYGEETFLQIHVRPTGGGSYTALTPRQPITATPYASTLIPGAEINTSVRNRTLAIFNSAPDGLALGVSSTNGTALSIGSSDSTSMYASALDASTIIAINNSETKATISAQNFGDDTFHNGTAILAETDSDFLPTFIADNGASGDGVKSTSNGGVGVRGTGTNSGIGVAGDGPGTSGTGVYGTGGHRGVEGHSTLVGGIGVEGTSNEGKGVYGVGNNDGIGVAGVGNGIAGTGVTGSGSTGVYGLSTGPEGTGVSGTGYYGVFGFSGATFGAAIVGVGQDGANAGEFTGHVAVSGNVDITGNLSKGGGSFKIDSPLDPANKYLYHSFVESPDMMNIYNGNVTTDASGNATVTLPNYFNALNRDYRYQLTVMGQQFAQAIVSSKVNGNKFSIKTDKPNIEVSWQVTGIRQDPYANANRIPVEVDKAADDKGKYLYPALYGKSDDLKIGPKAPVQSPKTVVTPGK